MNNFLPSVGMEGAVANPGQHLPAFLDFTTIRIPPITTALTPHNAEVAFSHQHTHAFTHDNLGDWFSPPYLTMRRASN